MSIGTGIGFPVEDRTQVWSTNSFEGVTLAMQS